MPRLMEVPVAMVKAAEASVGSAPILLYNMCALCLAYAYVTRTLATSPLAALPPGAPEHLDARTTLARLVPFLADRRSTLIHPTLESVVADFAARFEPGVMTPRLLALLLRDAEALLRPAHIALLRHLSPTASPVLRAARSSGSLHASEPGAGAGETLDLTAHPARRAILVLSDLLELFGAAPRSGCVPQRGPPHVHAHSLAENGGSGGYGSGGHGSGGHGNGDGHHAHLHAHGRSHSVPDIARPQSAGAGRSADGMPAVHGGGAGGRARKGTYVTHKLTFYAAHVLGAPTAMLRVLADEVGVRAGELAREAEAEAQRGGGGLDLRDPGLGRGRSMVVELA